MQRLVLNSATPWPNPLNRPAATKTKVQFSVNMRSKQRISCQLLSLHLQGFAGGLGVWQVPLQSSSQPASSVAPVRCQSKQREGSSEGGERHHWSGRRDATSHENRAAVRSRVTDRQPQHSGSLLKVFSGLAASQVPAGLGANTTW